MLWSLLLLVVLVVPRAAAQWTRLWAYDALHADAIAQPWKRAAHVMIAFEDSIYVHGGMGDTLEEDDHEFDDTWKFDLVQQQWTRIGDDSSIRPPSRFHHAAALHSNTTTHEMIIFGGLSVQRNIDRATQQLNLTITQFNEVWRLSLNSTAAPTSEIWALDSLPTPTVATTSTSTTTNGVPLPRSEAGIAIHGDLLYVFGGIMYDDDRESTPHDLNDLWSYDLATCVWTRILPRATIAANGVIVTPALVPTARFSHTVTLIEDVLTKEPMLLVISGRHLNAAATSWDLLSDMWVYALERKKWVGVTLSTRVQRAYTSVIATHGGQMWLFGGYYKPLQSQSGYVYSDLVSGVLQVREQHSWSKQTGNVNTTIASMRMYHGNVDPAAPHPALRYNHQAALWRDTMVLHGGSYQSQYGDVWMYNLSRAELVEATTPQLPADVTTLIYVLAGLVISIIIALVFLIAKWRAMDRRQLEQARMRGVTVMHGVAKERLDRMEVIKYKKPVRVDTEHATNKRHEELDQEETSSGSEDVCPICLIEFEEGEDVRNLPCHHPFHVACIDEWLKLHTTCPMCKNNLDQDPGAAAASPTAATVSPSTPPARGGAVVTPVEEHN